MRNRRLKDFFEQNSLGSVLYNLPRLLRGYQPIYLDYPVHPVPRYGYGKPAHPELAAILAEGDSRYIALLASFLSFTPGLLAIPIEAPPSSPSPSWLNPWLEGLDTFVLYSMVAATRPARYVEVGSGFSTRVVRRAIDDHALSTQLISIDPQPRAEINSLCTRIVREPLEQTSLDPFASLASGDILFIDGSHRSFMNSDVTVFFLEILPRLQPGIRVHIHDICLPWDYPPQRAHWFYSEQYLLAASLLAGHANYQVLMPNAYIGLTHAVSHTLDAFWANPHLAGIPPSGSSFWIETR